MTRKRKLEVFEAIITSKPLYGFSRTWLNTTERRRLDGFQNRCLRSIWAIKPAYLSRVSNASVLEQTRQRPLSTTKLAKQQLLLFGKVAREPAGSPMRDATFHGNTLAPKATKVVRRRGLPSRLEWTSQVYNMAVRAAGGHDMLQTCIQSPAQWRNLVSTFVSTM